MPISLSDYLEIDKKQLDDLGCFDTIIDLDSLFFINFLRLKDCKIPEFLNSYENLHSLFHKIGILLSQSKQKNDFFYRNAYKLLDMKEFEEICLGYSIKSTSGAGSGHKLKEKILDTGHEIIKAGVNEPEIFELVGLFEENIGPDRISDFIGKVIKNDLINYSKRILSQLDIKKEKREEFIFIDGLLFNKFNRKKLLLLPNEILHELPIARDWSDIEDVCLKNAAIRKEINDRIGYQWKNLAKADKKSFLKKLLLEDKDLLLEIIKEYKKYKLYPYDFESDPLGETLWYHRAKEYSRKHPLLFSTKEIKLIDDLVRIVREICTKYKELIENNGLNEILFDDDGNHRKERIAQRLFYGIADSYCQANDIGLSPEANSGRGAVDFKFNIGYNIRAIVEVKLTLNTRLDHGYNEQINEYLKAEKNSYPFYLVIDNCDNPKRFIDLKNLHSTNLSKGINCPELIVVDANLKPTASKI